MVLPYEKSRFSGSCAEAVEAVDVPVTVKMRIGWDSDSINVVDFAKRIESTGVAAIAVHGRTKEQMYSGHADWFYIKAAKSGYLYPLLAMAIL